MPTSEIDDIFAKKQSEKPNIVMSGSSKTSKTLLSTRKPTKSKQQKSTKAAEETALKLKKRPAPETVFDPSIVGLALKKTKVSNSTKILPSKSVKVTTRRDEGEFADSRGTGRSQYCSLPSVCF